MSAETQKVRSSKLTSGSSTQESTKIATVGDETPLCCGKPMQPRFAHAQDRYGNALFVTVWRCLHCGKSVY